VDSAGRRRGAAGAEATDGMFAYEVADAQGARVLLGDGSFGGPYERPQEDLDRVWEAAVSEARDALENGWR
jgi:hypothetical protein